MKSCSKCGGEYPFEEFPIQKHSKTGRHPWCFPCKRLQQKVYQANYVARDPQRRKDQANKYAKANKSDASNRSRLLKYGVSNAEVTQRIEAQGGVCALCRKDFQWGHTFVDHDHGCCPRVDGNTRTCGKCLRGILCRLCNQGLGMFEEDPTRLREAADYIEKYRK